MLQFSGMIRLMQRPVAMQSLKVEGGGGAQVLRGREEEEEMRRQGGEWKVTPVVFIRTKG